MSRAYEVLRRWVRPSIESLILTWALTACSANDEDRGPATKTAQTAPPQAETQLSHTPAKAVGRPNVVWILLDACRADHLSCYGYNRETSPNIDRLAAQGSLFEQNYAQAPSTLLSVPSYMTGRYEPVLYQDGRRLNIWFLRTAPTEERLIGTIMADNGYDTAMFSASPWYSEKSRLGRSFHTFERLAHGPEVEGETYVERNPALFTWIKTRQGAPFFLYIHSLDTHEPRFINNTSTKWIDPSFESDRDVVLRRWRGSPFSDRDREHIANLYDGGILYADKTVGEILRALEDNGLRENTFIIISSDHGEVLGQDGLTLGHPDTEAYDDLLHVPLVLAGPGVPAGLRVTEKTENTDIVPTLVDLIGLSTTAQFDGITWRSILSQESGRERRKFTFARTQAFHLTTEPNRILRFDDIKFDLSPFKGDEFSQLNLPTRSPILAWTVPDYAGHRKPISPTAAQQTFVRTLLQDRFLPLWQTRAAQPTETPALFQLDHKIPFNREAVTGADSATDNLWTRQRVLVSDPAHAPNLLISYAWKEKAPGLIFVSKVPNGTYEVSIFSTTLEQAEPRGSSFRFLVARVENEFRYFALDPPEPGGKNEAWFDVGTYEVTDGVFRYWVDQGDPSDNAVIGPLRFVKAGAKDVLPTREELEADKERLTALGYLN